MGYTHYWERNQDYPEVAEADWKQIIRDVRNLFRYLPEHSKSSGGYYADAPLLIEEDLCGKAPIANIKEIRFNGKGYDKETGEDLSHETFYFPRRSLERFDFCKTERKPYDLVVQAVLLVIKHHVNGTKATRLGSKELFLPLAVTSDGDPEDWKEAEEFVKRVCGYGEKFR